MRIQKTNNGLTVLAVAGTHTVLFGFNMSKSKAKGVMGFAVMRTDEADGQSRWLRGFKRFASTDPGVPAGKSVSTREHPVQSMQWADYSVNPGASYVYRVVALRGTPQALIESESVTVRVTLEHNDSGKHRVWFNCGAASSQAYKSRFGDRSPDDVGNAAFVWLSRGLFEAFDAFLARAQAGWTVRAALYECHFDQPMRLFKRAVQSGADVRILYDARKQTPTSKEPEPLGIKNANTIAKLGLKSKSIKREANPSSIAHNKFVVLVEGDIPRAVWTGSMNLTKNGIYGQSNVGHVVEDRAVARAFLEYWERLAQDPQSKDLKPENLAASSIEDGPIPNGTTAVFSPRPDNGQLIRIADLVDKAKRAAFITLPFGIVATMAPGLSADDGVLRCILLDSPGNAPTHHQALKTIRRMRNVVAAVGNRIETNELDHWVQEKANPWSTNVEYVHAKYLLIDPLSDDPLVITGSANFSDPSVVSNDENTLIIRGDTRVADIYLTEFKRLFDHHAFRETVKRNGGQSSNDPSPLKEHPEEWLARHYDDGGPGDLRRRYFGGAK